MRRLKSNYFKPPIQETFKKATEETQREQKEENDISYVWYMFLYIRIWDMLIYKSKN